MDKDGKKVITKKVPGQGKSEDFKDPVIAPLDDSDEEVDFGVLKPNDKLKKLKELMINFIINLVKLINMYKKTGGSDIDKEDFKRFINTIIGISHLDYRDKSIEVDGFNYPLADYKVHSHFVGFALARGVFASVGIEYEDLMSNYPYLSNSLMTPREFQSFQELILVKYKIRDISWSNDMLTLSQPLTINEALGKLGDVNGYVHCDDVNVANGFPIYLTCNIVKDMYYDTPINAYLDSFARNFITNLVNN